MLNLLFAWRYFKAKKTTQAINVIAWISATAIMLITAAFIVLLSVFNGFEGLVKSLYSSFYADLRVTPTRGTVMTVTPEMMRTIQAFPEVKAYSGVVEEKALLQNGDLQAIVFLKGVDDRYRGVSGVADKIVRGAFELGTAAQPGLVLGGGIESILAVDVERSIYPLTVYLFRKGMAAGTTDLTQSFASDLVAGSGTFFIQQDIDGKYALTNIDFMRRMMGIREDVFTSLEIAVRDQRQVNALEQKLKSLFRDKALVESRYEQNRSLYQVMSLEKWAIYGILTLMLAVAAFTMIGSLTMLVMEKQKDIQVLKSLGATRERIERIFITEGLLLGAIGGLAGYLLGLLICWLQLQFKIVPIQGGTFLINYYPVELRVTDFLLVGATVITVALLASWVPGRRAAQQPVTLKSL